MADDAFDVEDAVEEDDFAELYLRAMTGDEDARADLWHEFRRHMHNVIRYKAADLSLEWAVDPDEIYDLFFVALFTRCRPIHFEDRIHFARYVEKSVRRSTKRTLQAGHHHYEINLEACAEMAIDVSVLDELIWNEQFDAACAALTDREHTICALVIEGCTWRDVGQRLGLADNTVRMIHRRAVDRIREQILGGGGNFKTRGGVQQDVRLETLTSRHLLEHSGESCSARNDSTSPAGLLARSRCNWRQLPCPI
ncbi:MAG: sigma-70 family RNA polymerase sigma factor [Planctomycetota bacterium]|nr:sigma-70 family RNA polymerase sigma factor [Planctomycetota bacterium]